MLDGYEQQDNDQHHHSKRCGRQRHKEAPAGRKTPRFTIFFLASHIESPTQSNEGRERGWLGWVEDRCDRRRCKEIGSPVVPPTHAVVQPFAMVIKVFHTLVANSTVLHFRAAE